MGCSQKGWRVRPHRLYRPWCVNGLCVLFDFYFVAVDLNLVGY